MTPEEEIREIEEELSRTKYNKATQGHIGRLKARLARLRAIREKRAGGGRHGLGYAVRKEGDATLVLVGFPSAGKSTLLNRLSNAESRTGEYDFTTISVVPGMMELNGAKVQVLDIPGFMEGASSGKGRGREVLSVLRAADLILIILDAGKDYKRQLNIIRRELHDSGFRLNQSPPRAVIQRREGGGLAVGSAVRLTKLDTGTIKQILQEFRILNAEVTIREDLDMDQLIDALSRNRRYVPALVLLNKSDLLEGKPGIRPDLEVSSLKGTNLERLRNIIWEKLGLMRVFLKKIGKEPDLEEPMILRRGSTIMEVCRRIHRELSGNFRHARIWGPSARFPGQRKGGDHILRDGDVVELHV